MEGSGKGLCIWGECLGASRPGYGNFFDKGEWPGGGKELRQDLAKDVCIACVCLRACLYVSGLACMCLWKCVFVYVYMCVRVSWYVSMGGCVYICERVRICVYLCMHVCFVCVWWVYSEKPLQILDHYSSA